MSQYECCKSMLTANIFAKNDYKTPTKETVVSIMLYRDDGHADKVGYRTTGSRSLTQAHTQ